MRKTHRLKEDFFILQSEGAKNSDSVLVKMTVTASENTPATPEQSLNTTSGPVSPYPDSRKTY
ncbi:hypothetical protein VC180_17640 [Citrobacter braakii]|uniref:hypothetical protein n=1 Tax=Citrobacter braakii TaxID=57706 RepID=UPI002B36DC4B|nr:hypothetical protein [Citrobacter braakii]MEB2724196.1 hypothetical protein [Citrobacter braakii]